MKLYFTTIDTELQRFLLPVASTSNNMFSFFSLPLHVLFQWPYLFPEPYLDSELSTVVVETVIFIAVAQLQLFDCNRCGVLSTSIWSSID